MEYEKAPIYFETHQLFYVRDNRVLPMIEKRDLLVAMSSDLKIYIQNFSSLQISHRKQFKECSRSLAASLLLEGKLKSVLCLKENDVLNAVYDENSFLNAVKNGYKFYIQ